MKTIIIGGGPAGMIAGIFAKTKSNDVEIIEKNEKLGKKLYLTGKGRCNITNARPISEFFSEIPKNPKFLYHAFSVFDNNDLILFLNSNHLKTKIEQGNRVFPVSDKSSDVIKILEKSLIDSGVKINFNEEVKSIHYENHKSYIETDKRKIEADNLIIATGGKSYPSTGSTGEMFDFLKILGVKIITPKPSLTPIILKDDYSHLAGISLINVGLTLYNNSKKKPLFSEVGEMIFTHSGISGPLVLKASSFIEINKEYDLSIDLKPGLSLDELDGRILRDFEDKINADVETALGKLTIKKLIPIILNKAEVSSDKKVNQLTKEERLKIAKVFKDFILNFKSLAGFNEAIVTSGGVDVKEVNPKTMELKKFPGVFVAGEMLDVSGFTGGYNLQIAFSTGYVAGNSIGGSNESN